MRTLALAAAFVAACSSPPVPEPVAPTDSTDENCAAACQAMEALRCPGWRGSPGGDEMYGTADDVPCAEACLDIVEAYPGSTLHQDCVAAAGSCEEVEACFGASEPVL